MSIALTQILALVGSLDDSPGEGTPRERFRSFLAENVQEAGQVRDYIEECLRKTGTEYNRALQDLVNHLGRFLGFEVSFGRYQGVSGQIGFDGHWRSPTGFHVVVEVKTTDAYAIKAATLVGYVDGLISEKLIPSWERALGLYVVGRPDAELHQLENAIVAEKRTHQLRVISVESLLSLAELMSEYDVSHDDVLAVLQPSGPTVDHIVDLMARLVAQGPPIAEPIGEGAPFNGAREEQVGEGAHWLTPVRSEKEESAEECIERLVGKEGIYAFGERTPGRKHLKPGDRLAFYAVGNGVVASAKVSTAPTHKLHSKVRDSERYPWVFRVEEVQLHLDRPVIIDAELRARLDAFAGRDLDKGWAWFVQATRKISQRDFELLTEGKP